MSAPLDNNFLDVLSDDVDQARPLQLPVLESRQRGLRVN
ncbi:hypothetical protein J2W36_004099 [Variovorax ginsengisoli]|uniref:Uncharacterized protein n=1 Tax=Variovorax ginsengisoli TaxID=363844 RepID=A0ABT9SBV3_9BURK|nr:hypothetical protein [Variovorax ginsengisoli]